MTAAQASVLKRSLVHSGNVCATAIEAKSAIITVVAHILTKLTQIDFKTRRDVEVSKVSRTRLKLSAERELMPG